MQHATPGASSSTHERPPQDIPSSSATNVPNYQSWDRALHRFLKSAGLVQALNGFENDMLVINIDSEKEDILSALEQLQQDLSKNSLNEKLVVPVAEERKLDYVHLANSATPVTHTQLTRSISAFIAQNRARNNISNRNEFLRKRRRVDIDLGGIQPEGSSPMQVEWPTCARTDAVPVNRDVQMKYDVAKNEGGPLRRTVKSEPIDEDVHCGIGDWKGKGKVSISDHDEKLTLQQHPGLGERFANMEDHLAVRYVPSPPAPLLDRMRFLEDHIVRLERDYPPWAALHFNQPSRGWPPPPRATPLIVPSHLTSTINPSRNPLENRDSPSGPAPIWPVDWSQPGGSRGSTVKPKAKAKSSSLHRAVMQKLEVKKALAGED